MTNKTTDPRRDKPTRTSDDQGVSAPTWQQICTRRMDRHGLITPLPTIETAVRAMASTHAQVISAAEVSIGLRTGVTKDEVQRKLWDDQTLIKMYGLRGTVHLVPAEDFGRWITALDVVTQPPNIKGILTADQTDAVLAALDAAVADGPRTMTELDAYVIEATGSWAADPVMPNFGGSAPRWRHALGTATRRGVICFGPNRGRNSTYQKAPSVDRTDPDEAVNWLVMAFLHAYGPATPDHFARWMAGAKSIAKRAFDDADLDETAFGYVIKGDDTWPDPIVDYVRLLPYFDAYTVGCHPRSELFPGAALERAAPGGSAGNFPVILLDGSVVGVWHQRKSGRKIHLTIEPLQPLSHSQREQVHDQAERIAAIVGAEATVAFDSVTVMMHR